MAMAFFEMFEDYYLDLQKPETYDDVIEMLE